MNIWSLSLSLVLLFPMGTLFTDEEFEQNSFETCNKSNIPKASWCQDILCQFGKRKMRYIHNFRAGGTFVRYLMRLYCPIFEQIDGSKSSCLKNRENIQDEFLFTFVRDPIERYLSGYYEVMRKIDSLSLYNTTLEPGTLEFIKASTEPKQTKQNLYLQYVEKEMARTDDDGKRRVIDPYLAPQLGSLFNNNGSLPMDYISTSVDISSKLSSLMEEILGVKLPKNRFNSRMRERDTVDGDSNFIVERKELSQNNIFRIRQIYESDYLCFGDLLEDSNKFFSQKRKIRLPHRSPCRKDLSEEEDPILVIDCSFFLERLFF